MQITCAQPHRVSDVIFSFEQSDLTPYYATVDSFILQSLIFTRLHAMDLVFICVFICIFIFKYQEPTPPFFLKR